MILDVMRWLFAVLIYPGMLTVVVVALLIGRLVGGPASGGLAIRGLRGALRGTASFPHALSAALAWAAIALLPWPALPWQTAASSNLWLLWCVVELSVLATALAGFSAPSPIVIRSAVRTAQLGLSGRLVMWLATAAVLAVGTPITGVPALAIGCAALAAVLAFPAAAVWAPFGYEPFGNGGPLPALRPEDAALAAWARRLLTIFWLALFSTVFIPLPALGWWIALPVRLGLLAGLAAIVRGMEGVFANRSLPGALRWCWYLALPCALFAMVLVSLAQ